MRGTRLSNCTTAERNVLTANGAAAGTEVFDTDLQNVMCLDGSNWINQTDTGGLLSTTTILNQAQILSLETAALPVTPTPPANTLYIPVLATLYAGGTLFTTGPNFNFFYHASTPGSGSNILTSNNGVLYGSGNDFEILISAQAQVNTLFGFGSTPIYLGVDANATFSGGDGTSTLKVTLKYYAMVI